MALEGTAGNPDKNERIEEAVSRLHPALREALKSAPAANVMYKDREDYDGEFVHQEFLLRSIDDLNKIFSNLVGALDNENGLRLWSRAGQDMMNCVGFNSRW